MPPSFDSIPIDIRHEIYSYILLDQNVAYVKSDTGSACDPLKWGLKFETALFRVSKSISRESLEYFYSRNAFIVIAPERFNATLLNECRKTMPMCYGPLETIAFNGLPFALKIQLSLPPALQILVSISTGPNIDLSTVFGPPRNIRVRTHNTNISESRSGSISIGTNTSPHYKGSKSFQAEDSLSELIVSNSIAMGRYVNRGELDSPFRKITQPILYKPAPTKAIDLHLFPTIIAARHLPQFMNLLNEYMSKIYRLGNFDRSELTLKFGTSYSSLRIFDLLVDGLTRISNSNSTSKVLLGQNLDTPNLSRLDVRLHGALSQRNRERIIAVGISTIGRDLDSSSSDGE